MIESLHIYLSGSHVYARRRFGMPWNKKIEQLGEWEWRANQPDSLTLDRLPRSGSWRDRLTSISFYLGSACCKFMVVDLPKQVSDPEELRMIAASQMQYQLGLNKADWSVTVDIVTATAKSPGNAIACAMRNDLADRIRQLCNQKHLRLISMQPFIAPLWNRYYEQCNDSAPLALFAIEDDALTVLSAQQGTISAINSFIHADNPVMIEREIKRLGATLTIGDTQHIYIAQSRRMAQHSFADRGIPLNPPSGVTHAMPADFSDLLLGAETGSAR